MEYDLSVFRGIDTSETIMKNAQNQQPLPLKFGDLRVAWLETFVSVARLRNRSEVAKEIGISQSAVSKHIQSVENWMGVRLVDPESLPAILTKDGEAFAVLAKSIIESLSEARRAESLEALPLIRRVSVRGRKPTVVPPVVKATRAYLGLPPED